MLNEIHLKLGLFTKCSWGAKNNSSKPTTWWA